MSRRPSIAERIVFEFRKNVTEAHRDVLCSTLGIGSEQFDQSIPKARDLGVEFGLRLTPIYERDGWWTSRPTERILTIAEYESMKRNAAEQMRNARVADGTFMEGFAKFHAAQLSGSIDAYLKNFAERLEIDPRGDYIITAVDEATKSGQSYVLKPAEAA